LYLQFSLLVEAVLESSPSPEDLFQMQTMLFEVTATT
jgi:hypothetical protein